MFERILTRKMWTREAREASAKTRAARAGQRTSNSQIQAPTYTNPSAQLQPKTQPEGLQPVSNPIPPVSPPLSPTHASQRTTPPEYAANGGGIDHVAVANEIARQYGGHRFKVMTGASNFTASKTPEGHPYLSFKIPRAKGITHVKTILRPNDTYDVHMIGVHGKSVKEKHVAHGMHADQLEGHFSHHTGLSTRLF